MRRFLLAAVAALMVGMLVFPTAASGAPAAKTVVCHGEGNGTFHAIEVADKAVPAHLAHGDGFPGAAVPGDDASIFDLDCNVVPFPTSCQEWRDLDPVNNGDGDYEILAGQRFTLYCHDMAGTPTEYLNLVNTGSNFNFSQYTVGGNSVGTNVRTNYTKVRLDPVTLSVDVSDQTFSSSTGLLEQRAGSGNFVTSMPYGVAMDCRAPLSTTGVGNVDLTGTPFKVIDPFAPGAGFRGAGTAIKSASDQVVDLTGGGFCGFTTPEVSPSDPPTRGFRSPSNQGGGINPPGSPPSFILDLAFLP